MRTLKYLLVLAVLIVGCKGMFAPAADQTGASPDMPKTQAHAAIEQVGAAVQPFVPAPLIPIFGLVVSLLGAAADAFGKKSTSPPPAPKPTA